MSEFAPQGNSSVGSLNAYAENQTVRDYSGLEEAEVVKRIRSYMEYQEDENLMPRVSNTVKRILTHLAFELKYKQGGFDYVIKRNNEVEHGTNEATAETEPTPLTV